MASRFENKETAERNNPEVEELFDSLYHHLSYFLFLSPANEPTAEHLRESDEIIDKMLLVSKNRPLISVLERLKDALREIRPGFKPAKDFFANLSALRDEANEQEKF